MVERPGFSGSGQTVQNSNTYSSMSNLVSTSTSSGSQNPRPMISGLRIRTLRSRAACSGLTKWETGGTKLFAHVRGAFAQVPGDPLRH